MEKYIKIDRISDISDDKWTLLSQEIKKGNKKLNFEPTDTFISGYEYIRSQHHLNSTLQNVISLLSKDEKTDIILMSDVISARDLLQEEINMLKL